jgi:hypothetical protein
MPHPCLVGQQLPDQYAWALWPLNTTVTISAGSAPDETGVGVRRRGRTKAAWHDYTVMGKTSVLPVRRANSQQQGRRHGRLDALAPLRAH